MDFYFLNLIFLLHSSTLLNSNSTSLEIKNLSTKNLINIQKQNSHYDQQIEIVKQQVWENLQKVPGTERDYTSEVTLKIANGNIIDADCKIFFPASSWVLASIFVKDYQEVLQNTSTNFFAVIYKLITDNKLLASEIYINGLWRPFGGSHVHPQGRGMDIGYIRSSTGDGVIFNTITQTKENAYGKLVRESFTIGSPVISQYLCPWFICNPSSDCKPNQGVTPLEKQHLNHLHLTIAN
jgi:hypothetical protein